MEISRRPLPCCLAEEALRYARRIGPLRLLRLALLLLFAIDALVRRPLGFILFSGDHGPPSAPCGWDLEGTWQIGMMAGGEGDARPPWRWEVAGDGTDDMRIDAKKVVMPMITCADLGADPAASFVADPFLVRNPDLGESWFVFYEYKHLGRMAGEIGVSESVDGGKTWTFRGAALTEPFHLSNPFVIWNEERKVWQMIPETHQARDVRIYETSAEKFPHGWRLAHTPLKGERCVDTMAVWQVDRYWIYTTVLPHGLKPFAERKNTLRLYHARDLSDLWIEHPASPVVVNDRQFGRSGGPPVVYGDNVYRFAQDGTTSYGEGVHVLRAHVLTRDLYEEQHVRFIRPEEMGGAARFHHLDAHREEDGTWLAVFDYDIHPENYEYFRREGWLYCTKRAVLAFLAVYVLWDVSKVFRHECGALRDVVGRCVLRAFELSWRVAVDVAKAWRSSFASRGSVWSKVATLSKLGLAVACSFLLALVSTDARSQCIDRGSFNTDQCFRREHAMQYIAGSKTMLRPKDGVAASLSESVLRSSEAETLIVVTAASAGFMERLRNFIGSVHYWEPEVQIELYDLGLTDSDLDEIAQWKRVTVLPFPFDKYPPHVALLYNFAWKIAMLNEVIQRHPRLIYIDSGVEIRRPLADVRYFLEKDGYYGIHLQGGNHLIGRQTHPDTYSALKKMGAEFDADEVSRFPFCAGGVQGLVRGRVESLLGPALDCALDRECIAPMGSGRNNHDYDQSVLSVLAYATGRGKFCHVENIVDRDPIGYTADETRCNNVQMGTRRWRKPKLYKRHIDRHVARQAPPERKGSALALESSQTGMFKPQGDSKWQRCVSDCDKEEEDRDAWEACAKGCPMDHGKEGFVFINTVAELDYVFYLIRKGTRCGVVLYETLCFVLLFFPLWIVYSRRRTKKQNIRIK